MASAVESLSLSAIRYSRVAMWFHWAIAALIVVNLLLASGALLWGLRLTGRLP